MTQIQNAPLQIQPHLSPIPEDRQIAPLLPASETPELPNDLTNAQIAGLMLQAASLITTAYGTIRLMGDVGSVASIAANHLIGLCPNPCYGNASAICIDRVGAMCSINQITRSQTTTLAILGGGLLLKYLPSILINNPVILPQPNLPNPAVQNQLPLSTKLTHTFKQILPLLGIMTGGTVVHILWRAAWGTCTQTSDNESYNTCYTLFQNGLNRCIVIPTMTTGMILGTTLFSRVKRLLTE